MERVQEDAGPVAEHRHGSDHTATGLVVILLVIVALLLYVASGANIAFPSG